MLLLRPLAGARDSNGDEIAWRLKPYLSLMFVNGAGELDQKHDQDLRDTCIMLLDRAGCDLLTICDITGHPYRSAQTIVKHYRVRNADRARIADGKERMKGSSPAGPEFGAVVQFCSRRIGSIIFPDQASLARHGAPFPAGNDIHCEHYCSSKVCCAPGYTTIRDTTEPSSSLASRN